MPRTPTSKSEKETKPYDQPPSPTSPSPRKRKPILGKTWTPEEKVKLLEVALKTGGKANGFEGQIEGRTGHQCYQTRHHTVLPALKKHLSSGGK
ncbi:hypothetical protein M231_05541 [Tremella mesenterica]|uniref:Myb-like domain-containing protein n=1 Tax=Tremella mesenterica TaxID=5217 RepID=A0A4Q1BHT8_TREME|nr:hypothetical protein M231_05541 [Tremella mesenterica]